MARPLWPAADRAIWPPWISSADRRVVSPAALEEELPLRSNPFAPFARRELTEAALPGQAPLRSTDR